jgi:NAD(P)-dependent dehydrogenase (short-subunit alcohol dehydrogenase family)
MTPAVKLVRPVIVSGGSRERRRDRLPLSRLVPHGEDSRAGRTLRADFGDLYGLVNNAGSAAAGMLGTMRDQDIEALIRLNTLAPIILTKYVVRSMMTARSGRIVNMASVIASTGY